jgi:hypothetical protein
MRYVICPSCGDAVAGKLPSGTEAKQLACTHCHHGFEFDEMDIRSGIVTYDDVTNRWRVAGFP